MYKQIVLILTSFLLFSTSVHAQMKVGMNINWVNMYQLGAIHNDAMIAAGPDWHPAWNTAGPDGKTVIYSPNGAPPPVGYHTTATYGYMRPGTYILKATGLGSLQVRFMGPGGRTVVLGTLPVSGLATFTAKAETYTFTIPPISQALWVSLTVQSTDPTTPLNNVQLLTPGAGTGLYHPEFLGAIQPFNCIRVMDPQLTNGSKEVSWSDRVTRPGQNLESFIALANALHRDLWICVPVRAVSANCDATDWAYRCGDMLNTTLDPGLKVYVEYSNEVWNFAYPWIDQTNYVSSQALLDYVDTNGRRWYAQAAYKIHQAIASRLSSNGPKLMRVFSGQLANIGTINVCLPWAINRGYKFDCLAGGMYWNLSGDVNAIKTTWTGGDQAGALKMVDDAYRKGEAQLLTWVKAYATYAQKYGMDLVAYEGGLGSGMWGDAVGLAIMKAYVTSPLCIQQHMDTYKDLEAAGVKLFNHYSYSHINPITSARLHAGDHVDGRYRSLLKYVQGAPPARYLGPDTSTQGNWVGSYGSLGATIAGSLSIQNINILSAATNSMPGPITDVRGLQTSDKTSRTASWWYSSKGFVIDVPAASDGSVRILSLYCVEWQNGTNDSFTITITDSDSGNVLDTRSLSVSDPSFMSGVYLRWVVEGHVKVSIKTISGNARVSGIFLDPVPQP